MTTPIAFTAPGGNYDPTNYTALVGEIRTGKIYAELPIFDGGCSVLLNRGGQISVKCKWDADLGMTISELKKYCTAGRMFLAFADDFHIVEAGPIWHWNVSSSGVFECGADGLWSLLFRRGLWTAGVTDLASEAADIDMTGLSPHGIINKMIQTAYAHQAFPYSYQVAAAGTSTETFPGWELSMVGERLQQFTERVNGPDVYLAPKFTSSARDSIAWSVEVGTPYLEQDGIDLVWDIPSEDIVDYSVEGVASELASTVIVKGDGQERGTIIGYASSTSLTDNGYPVMHRVLTNHSGVRLQTTADSYAQSYVADYALGRAHELWTVKVRADGLNPLSSIRPGNRARFSVGPNLFIEENPEGYQRRITGLTLQARENTLDLDVAPHWSEM